jgi:hypothetical protein
MSRRGEAQRCAVAVRGTPPEIELALLQALSIIVAAEQRNGCFPGFRITAAAGGLDAPDSLHRAAATPLCLAGWVHACTNLISSRVVSFPRLPTRRTDHCLADCMSIKTCPRLPSLFLPQTTPSNAAVSSSTGGRTVHRPSLLHSLAASQTLDRALLSLNHFRPVACLPETGAKDSASWPPLHTASKAR